MSKGDRKAADRAPRIDHSMAAPRFICKACCHQHGTWAPRCPSCMSLAGLVVVDDDATARVTLTRGELLHLKSFAESVDCDPDDVVWWDNLTNKLERAIARIDGTEAHVHRTPIVKWTPDPQPAICHQCGWEGALPKTSPCPSCGQKVNPIFFNNRKSAQ